MGIHNFHYDDPFTCFYKVRRTDMIVKKSNRSLYKNPEVGDIIIPPTNQINISHYTPLQIF